MAQTDVYWSATASSDGSGASASTPRQCNSTTQWGNLWGQYGNPGSTANGYNIHLAAGTYPTSNQTLRSHTHLLGAGQGSTTLTLTANGLMFGDGGGWHTDVVLQDFTVDLNPGGTGPVSRSFLSQGGGCDNLTVKNLKIIHFGTATGGQENFVIFIYGNAQVGSNTMANVYVDNCIFTQPSTNQADGCTLVTMAANPNVNFDYKTVMMRNCIFYDIDSWDGKTNAGHGNGAYTYAHCFTGSNCQNNYATNCDVFYYGEPAKPFIFPNLILNNRMVSVTKAVQVVFNGYAWNSSSQSENNNTHDLYGFQPATTGPTTVRGNYFERRDGSGVFVEQVNGTNKDASGNPKFAFVASANDATKKLSAGAFLIENNWIQDVTRDTTWTYPLINMWDANFQNNNSNLTIQSAIVRNNLFFCRPNLEVKVDRSTGVLPAFSAYGNTTFPQNPDRSAHITDLIAKMLIADWYGITAAYYDSYGPGTGTSASAYAVEAIRTAVTYAKNVLGIDFLFLPEAYNNNGMFSSARPYRDVAQGQLATPASTRKAWPNAAAATRWESTTATNGTVISLFPQGTSQYNATNWNATVGYIRQAYNAGDDMIATGTSGSPSDFQMAAYIFNRIANGSL